MALALRAFTIGLLAVPIMPDGAAGPQAEWLTPERQLALAQTGAPVPDPTGRRVVYAVTEYDAAAGERQTRLWLLDLASGQARQLTQGASATAPAWSADGGELHFLRGGQIWALPLDSGEAQQVTAIPTSVAGYAVNPNPNAAPSHRFAIHSRVHPDCPEAEWACSERARERWDARPALVSEQLPLRHWSSWRDSLRSHLFVGDPASDTWVDLTPGWAACPPFALSAGADYCFSPDGTRLAVVRNLDPRVALSTDNDVFVIELDEAIRRARAGEDPWDAATRLSVGLSGGGGVDDQPCFSPDGRWLAFTSMERGGCESDLRRVILHDLATGRERCLTCGLDRSAFGLIWSADARHLYFAASDRGSSALYRIAVASGAVQRLLRAGALGGLAPLPDGRLLAQLGSSRMPAEIFWCDPEALAQDPQRWREDLALAADGRFGQPSGTVSRTTAEVADEDETADGTADGAADQAAESAADRAAPHAPGALRQMTFHNWDALQKIPMNRPEHFWFAGARGDSVHGFVLRPPGGATEPWPLVLVLHGGPQWAYHDFWLGSYNFQMIAAQGFAVAAINFHGSSGFGIAFQDAIRGHWGDVPGEDVARGLDYVCAHYDFVDPARVAAIGRSFGGCLVNWLNGHSDRFRCLVAHSGGFDEAAGWGTTEELWFPEWEFGGPPWEQTEVYRANSPATFAAAMRTPTLVVHGKRDYRVDLSDGLQTYATLKRQGVAARFLMFPDEGHHIHDPEAWLFMWHEVLGWLQRYLGRT